MTWFLGIRGPYSFTGELLNQKIKVEKKWNLVIKFIKKENLTQRL